MVAMANPRATSIDSVVGGRRGILMALKKQGRVRAEDLAAQLGITTSAVRQHLSGLLGDGLVAFEEIRSGPGRPKHVYRLTPAAEELFPKTYSDLTNELLDYAGSSQPGLVDDLFEMRRQRRAEDARERLAGKDFDGRVEELARILDEDGYLAEAERLDDGSWRIIEHNCAILGVASRFGQACSSEIGFLRDVMPDAQIERTHHMIGGAHMCAYAVKPLVPTTTKKRGSQR
jgi:DeoR family transcriptional regulator, suf operon transcriptional repressor